jgi:beta-N-acetylhexosaminidase
LFISIDQEGGRVARLLAQHGFDFVLPAAQDLSALTMPEIYDKYKELGLQLFGLGFNLNFAPDTDVNVNPASPAIGALGRAYSADATLVGEYGRVAANGLNEAGIIASFKHFPGHGSAGTDTHAGLTDITSTWQEYELEPYADVPANTMVMVAHVINGKIDPTYPATLSQKTVNGLLRGQLGFQGVVITDDLQMGAIYDEYGFAEALRLAILAGNDVLLLGNNLTYTENIGRLAHEEIMKMVHNGDIPRERIQESYERIIRLKARGEFSS